MTNTVIEKALIGSFILNAKYFYECQGHISAKHFQNEELSSLFICIEDAYSKRQKLDYKLLIVEANKTIKIDLAKLKALISEATPSSNFEYIEIIKEAYKKHELANIIDESRIALGDKTPTEQIISNLDNGINSILSDDNSQSSGHVSEAIKESLELIHRANEAKGLSGIDTGFNDLNKLTGGWQPSDLIILAARPGLGKTTLACNYLLTVAEQKRPCAIFSLEMSKSQIVQVLASIKTGLSVEKMRRGDLSEQEINQITITYNKIHKLPLFIFDNKYSISQIVTTSRFLNRKYGLEFIVLDYLQLIDSEMQKASRNNQIEYVSRRLKLLSSAGDCNMTTIALSQLSRAVETRGGDKRPMLSDLRDSGAIEQDADLVTFLYRDSYYQMNNDLSVELIISKNRHGRIGVLHREYKDRKYIQAEKQFTEPTQFPLMVQKI